MGHVGVSVSQSMSRGQWERRLQTDIHMAKKALSEALSPKKTCSSSTFLAELNSNISNDNSTTKPAQSISYASSADNIARLLKGWMKNTPKRANTQNSFVNNLAGAGADTASSEGTTTKGSTSTNNSLELSETFESLFGYESLESSNSEFSPSLSPEGTLFQDESKPDITAIDMPFSLLEKWLLDDSGVQEKLGF